MQLSTSNVEFVEDYLMKDGRWFGLEYIVFANLSHGLPFKTNERLLKKMISEYNSFHIHEYTDLFIQTFYNLSIMFLENGELEEAEKAIDLVTSTKISSRILYIRHHVAFLKLALMWLKNAYNSEIKEQIRQFILVTKMIDSNLYKKNLNWLSLLGYETTALD